MLKNPIFRFFTRNSSYLQATWLPQIKYLQDLLKKWRGFRDAGNTARLGIKVGYTNNGRLNREATEFLISNGLVLKRGQDFPTNFWRVSPYNPKPIDAIQALDRCTEVGAILVKKETLALLRTQILPYGRGKKKNTESPYLSTDLRDYSPERMNSFAMGWETEATMHV